MIEVRKASFPLLLFGGYPFLFLPPNLAPSLNLWLLEYCLLEYEYVISYHFCPTISSNSNFHLGCSIRGPQAASLCILHFGQLFFLSQASSALTSVTCLNPCVPVSLFATFLTISLIVYYPLHTSTKGLYLAS